ncbi:MAG: DUF1573 domain-containing protein [Opitutaceae bacterium]|nr:DUF1573 domain-containing protein [Cytophagales bacterium]
MKLYFSHHVLFNLVLLTTTTCQKLPDVSDSTNLPVLQWEHNSFDFGTLPQGTKVSHEYKFKNTGSLPLIISNVLVTCGCTVPKWPKIPIPPKKTGTITIFFNSKGKIGVQNKTITILTNSKAGKESLMFSATVLPEIK